MIVPMLCGRPVVASGAEGARDLLPPGCGLIVSQENDVSALAAALAEYQRDPDRRAREGRLAREHAELTNSAAHVAAEFERIVKAAIAARTPA